VTQISTRLRSLDWGLWFYGMIIMGLSIFLVARTYPGYRQHFDALTAFALASGPIIQLIIISADISNRKLRGHRRLAISLMAGFVSRQREASKLARQLEVVVQELSEAQAIIKCEGDPIDRRRIPNWLRQYVIERDGQRCQYCGSQGTFALGPDDESWHIDHVIPIDRGGPTRADNLTLACATCNVRKGTMPAYLFVSRLIQEGGMCYEAA